MNFAPLEGGKGERATHDKLFNIVLARTIAGRPIGLFWTVVFSRPQRSVAHIDKVYRACFSAILY